MLLAFLKWLNDNYVIDHHRIKSDDDTGFYTRFRIQKCMYMAQCLGLGTDYHYRQYVYGPYSQDLTTEYYNYDPEAVTAEQLPPDFDEIGSIVLRAHSRGLAWMEVATTILEAARGRSAPGDQFTRDRIERDVAGLKYQYTDGYIHTVYGDLLEIPLGRGLPNTVPVQAAIPAP